MSSYPDQPWIVRCFSDPAPRRGSAAPLASRSFPDLDAALSSRSRRAPLAGRRFRCFGRINQHAQALPARLRDASATRLHERQSVVTDRLAWSDVLTRNGAAIGPAARQAESVRIFPPPKRAHGHRTGATVALTPLEVRHGRFAPGLAFIGWFQQQRGFRLNPSARHARDARHSSAAVAARRWPDHHRRWRANKDRCRTPVL
jgi:hypothetical protein